MICTDLHSCLSQILAKYDAEQVVVVMDENVEALSRQLSVFSLLVSPRSNDYSQANFPFPTLALRVSEATKSLETVQKIWDFLLAHRITRHGVVVCIGGGVLTDMGGFAAATYKRGIAYINVPTTLLAMVDASTGGKTGFNYGGLKNAIGAFYEAEETIVCPAFLSSLPSREFLSGFAEMLKTGLLEKSQELWNQLLQYDLEQVQSPNIASLIASCIAVKERIVASDPKESGLRKALNLGHTFGHALEEIGMDNQPSAVSNQQSVIPHGYAVLYGLIAELYLSVTLLGCPHEPLQQLTQLMLHYYGKPQCRCSDLERLIALMHQDKKNEHAAEINCTLLRQTGEPVTDYVISESQAREAWEYLFSL